MIKFKHEYKPATWETLNIHSEIEMTLPENGHSLSQLLEHFELFLKACGYVFDGHIELVEEDEPAQEPCSYET